MDALNYKNFDSMQLRSSGYEYAPQISESIKMIKNTDAGSGGKGKDHNFGKDMYCLTCGKSAIKKSYDIVKRGQPYPKKDILDLIATMESGCKRINYTLPSINLRTKSSKRKAHCLKYVNGKRDNMMRWLQGEQLGEEEETTTEDQFTGNSGGQGYQGSGGVGYQGSGLTNQEKTSEAGGNTTMYILLAGLVITVIVGFIIRQRMLNA